MTDSRKLPALSRRSLLANTARVTGLGFAASVLGSGLLMPRLAAASVGRPQPEETIESTIQRLFGDQAILDGESMMDFKLPIIAENGSVVQARIEVTRPQTPDQYVSDIYILVDANRRPMSAHYTFTPDSGAALIGTNLRLGGTTKVRAVVRMNDGTLYQASREVRVTVGGCGG